MDDLLARLAAPFPPEVVSWRVGNTNREVTQAMALAYIDARDVQDRLDQVCGVYWQVRHPWALGTKLACEIGILINGEWHWRGDGAGDSDIEAEKGAFSDSFKRAAVRWGIGRYLYDISSPWVAVDSYTDKNGKLRAKGIKDSEMPKLRGALARAAGGPVNPPSTTSKAPTPPQTPRKPAPGKFELLFANGDVMAKFDTPDEWFHGLREAITQPGAMVKGLWERNEPIASTLTSEYPDVQWAGKTGAKLAPYDLLAVKVRQLLSGIAA